MFLLKSKNPMLFRKFKPTSLKTFTKFFFSTPTLLNPNQSSSQAFNEDYDAIIIGAGHNGLVCANYLAKQNHKVLVLERRHLIGGAAVTEELYPGHKLSRASYVLSLLRKKIVDETFENDWREKLIFIDRRPSSFTPTTTEGRYLVLGGGEKRDLEEIGKFSKKDAKKYQEYNAMLNKIVQIISPLIDEVIFFRLFIFFYRFDNSFLIFLKKDPKLQKLEDNVAYLQVFLLSKN